MNRKRILIGLFLVFISFIAFAFFTIVRADGESWLTGWSYRQSHDITGSSGAGMNYQIKIIVNYTSGSSSGDTVYVDGKCSIDFDDIRFTDNDGETELDYWLEEKTDSDNAVFWVEVADDLDSNQVIYIYYGNDAVSNIGDGETTFLAWDNFDDGYSDGDSLNSSRGWETIKDAGDVVEIENNPSGSGLVLWIDDTGGASTTWANNLFDANYSYALHMKFRVSGERDYYFYAQEGDSTIISSYLIASNLKYHNGGGYVDFSPTLYFGTDVWYDVVYYVDAFVDDFDIDKDDSSYDGGVRNPSTNGCDNARFAVLNGATIQVFIDDFFIRKFVTSEPSHGIWGDEEEETNGSEFTEEGYFLLGAEIVSVIAFTVIIVFYDERRK